MGEARLVEILEHVCGNLNIICFDHFSRICQLHPPPHTRLCTTLYLVSLLIGADWCLESDVVTNSGPRFRCGKSDAKCNAQLPDLEDHIEAWWAKRCSWLGLGVDRGLGLTVCCDRETACGDCVPHPLCHTVLLAWACG